MSLSKKANKERMRLKRQLVQLRSPVVQPNLLIFPNLRLAVQPKQSPTGGSYNLPLGHTKPVPYPTNPTLKQSWEWEDYKTKLRK